MLGSKQWHVSLNDLSQQGTHPLLPNFPSTETEKSPRLRAPLGPGHFSSSVSYSRKKGEVLSVADKLNPIKIWWGAGAYSSGHSWGCQLAKQAHSQPVSQTTSQPGRQVASRPLSQPATSQTVRKPTSCLLGTPTSLAVGQMTSQ